MTNPFNPSFDDMLRDLLSTLEATGTHPVPDGITDPTDAGGKILSAIESLRSTAGIRPGDWKVANQHRLGGIVEAFTVLLTAVPGTVLMDMPTSMVEDDGPSIGFFALLPYGTFAPITVMFLAQHQAVTNPCSPFTGFVEEEIQVTLAGVRPDAETQQVCDQVEEFFMAQLRRGRGVAGYYGIADQLV
ncbi:hypothetical protein [Leifsonia sp. Leaf264]|uniref:hypothetical protein n=1 Tax=Leifsonia sp. Leaf264 TaxID=1736314 RepID=UPI0006F9EBC4|nr:hypothetical protein [Leifsonia sp. Leaf264]KQO98505.1 hypothetical protein ASF30_10610 [Leifsonia sp. Leaf264]